MKVKDAVKKTKAKVKEAEGPVDSALQKFVDWEYTVPTLITMIVGLIVAFAWCMLR